MDVITVGGVTIDAFFQVKQSEWVSMDPEKKSLIIKAGEKVVVDSCIFSLGGNACNVAVGLSRLGLQTALCAEIGTDEFAQKILKGLEKDSVDKTYLIQTSEAASSFAIALNVENERTLFVEHVVREHNFQFAQMQSSWMYLTSLGEKWEQAYEHASVRLEKGDIQLVFNPGTPQLMQSHDSIKTLLSKTAILCVNKQEAQALLRFYGTASDDMKEIIMNLQLLGPKIVSVTDGAAGAYANDENGTIYAMEKVAGEVVERTGAGDSYATGFSAAQIKGESVPTAMQWGALNAVSVIGHIGAQEGLLTQDALAALVTAHADSVARQL